MFIRVEVRAALMAALETASDGVSIIDGFNSSAVGDERIEVGGPVDDGSGPEVLAADTHPHDDRFAVDLLVFAGKSGQDITAASTRAQELMRIVHDAMRDPTFDSLTVTSGTGSAFLFDAVLGSASGPFTEPGDHGHAGYGSVTVNAHTRFRFS